MQQHISCCKISTVNVLQYDEAHYNTPCQTAMRCNALQHTATHCTATHCNTHYNTKTDIVSHCTTKRLLQIKYTTIDTLQRTATHCNMHCNTNAYSMIHTGCCTTSAITDTLQHIAMHCNIHYNINASSMTHTGYCTTSAIATLHCNIHRNTNACSMTLTGCRTTSATVTSCCTNSTAASSRIPAADCSSGNVLQCVLQCVLQERRRSLLWDISWCYCCSARLLQCVLQSVFALCSAVCVCIVRL